MTRQRVLRGARWVFVLVALASAWWGFRGRWAEVGHAVAGTGAPRLTGAVACAAVGLLLTGVLWRLLLRWVGSEVGARDAAAVFFAGQLGKYVPGSVWSVAVQAQLGRRHGVPARSSVAASSLFLVVHTATGLLVGGLLVVLGALELPGARRVLLGPVALAVGAVGLAPPLLRALAGRMAGPGIRPTLGPAQVARAVGLMTAVWMFYGASLLLLAHGPGAPGPSGAVAAFALAHALGVLVVLAPAGVGVREAVLVGLLAPVLGVPGSAAVALLSRVAHALADFVVAAAAVGCARVGRRTQRTDPVREPARVRGQ